VLFGLSTPAAKLLVGTVDPWLLAGVLYLGSGVGLSLYRWLRHLLRRAARESPVTGRDLFWLGAAIVFGGIIGPVLLVHGLATGTAVQSSLLLNLEGVFTALLAWSFFREHFSARIATGMAFIVLGGATLSWMPSAPLVFDASAMLVTAACLAWAIDNNLTRKVSGGDPVQIAALKGVAAGSINVLVALSRGASWPTPMATLGAAVVGVLGYGVSLVLFVLSLRLLGTARTGAYFSTAPFVGAVTGILVLQEPLTLSILVAMLVMAAGVWLHLSERHEHEHLHEPLEHAHLHSHDEHHQHEHARGTPTDAPHSHAHRHTPIRHSHPHYPDLHHRHDH
jgi:drug/metabolite transporter (DMT)-like permease